MFQAQREVRGCFSKRNLANFWLFKEDNVKEPTQPNSLSY